MSNKPPYNPYTGNPADAIRTRLQLLNEWLHRIAWEGDEDKLTSGWPTMGTHAVRVVSSLIFYFSKCLSVDFCHAEYQQLGCASL